MQTQTAPAAKPRGKAVVIGLIILAVFAVLFALLLTMFSAENQSTVTQFMQGETSKSGYIDISAKCLSVDPIKGETATRLEFTPEGDLDDSGALASDMTLYVNSSTGKAQVAFKKGEMMNPMDVVLDTYGNVGLYPFDSHESALYLSMEDADGGAVPFTLEYTAATSGYKIQASQSQDSETGYIEMDMEIARSATAVIFSVFIMLLEWLLALSALGATIVWIRGRKIEVTMFGWMGALLFALVPLRNAMPGVPPVGVLGDMISFFWAEIIVAVSLVLSVATWLRRGSEGKAK